MTHKLLTLKKAAIAITILTSSVAFAQSAPSGSFIPADGVVGAGGVTGGVGGGSAVMGGVGGLSGVVIGAGILAAIVVVAVVADNKSSNTPSGTTGTR